MSRKKIILLVLLVIAIAAAFYGYKEYTRTNERLDRVKPDYRVTASSLIREFETNDLLATRKYNGKIVEVNGFVKAVEKDEQGFYTIVLGDSVLTTSVRCSVDTTQQADAAGIQNNSSATIRGVCTGFNKDEMGLGSDIILNRCVLLKK
jgi:hypothetical protein